MSPRKTILKELARADAGNTPYRRPSEISGFSTAPEKYQKAVNSLLSDRLLEGRKDEDGHMTIAINEHRKKDVEREIRPVWARPVVWVAVLVVVAGGVALASFMP